MILGGLICTVDIILTWTTKDNYLQAMDETINKLEIEIRAIEN